MTFYNKVLSKLFLIGILLNGCASMALVGEFRQMQDKSGVLEGAALHESLQAMPPTITTKKHIVPVSYSPRPQRKPLVRS